MWISKQGRDQAEALARLNNLHAERMAREDRLQHRLSDAYIELLEFAERFGQWVAQLRPSTADPARSQQASMPGLAEQARVQALVSSYGSPEVKALAEVWLAAVKEVAAIDVDIRATLDDRRTGAGHHVDYTIETWNNLEYQMRPAEKEARTRLTRQISDELQGVADD